MERRRRKRRQAADKGREKGKAELWGPASLCDVEPHARSGRSVRRRETFRSLVTRSALRLPAKRRRDPTTVRYFTSRCYDAASALAGLKPLGGGTSGAEHPFGPASRYC